MTLVYEYEREIRVVMETGDRLREQLITLT